MNDFHWGLEKFSILTNQKSSWPNFYTYNNSGMFAIFLCYCSNFSHKICISKIPLLLLLIMIIYIHHTYIPTDRPQD
jgi:hypothetical protein